ncbi:unnamed protein product [Amoebophrya sp. A120]|nr:unnamed protein product [Amoebophrya sp. A120]|eukprot:GSA120T00002898001.1
MSSARDRIAELQELQAQRRAQLEEQREKVEALKRASTQLEAQRASLQQGTTRDTTTRKSYKEVLNELLPGRFSAADQDPARAPTLHRPSNLDVVKKLASVNIPPLQTSEAYEKGVQAGADDFACDDGTSMADDNPGARAARAAGNKLQGRSSAAVSTGAQAVATSTEGLGENQNDEARLLLGDPGNKMNKTNNDTAGAASSLVPKKPPEPMTEEDSARVLQNPEFVAFFEKSSKMIEKLLAAPQTEALFDRDYQHELDEGEKHGEEMVEIADFESSRWTRDRTTTDVQWSPHFPELFCASYGPKKNATLSDDEGVVCVWNLALQNRPEFVFTAGSQVLSVRFDKFNPALYLGSTYSGSIVLWDSRTNRRVPVQRTALISGRGHAHPVYAMEQVGARGGELISISTDGRLCLWNLSMLVHPQECVDLRKGSRDLVVNSMAFGSENAIWTGAEDGSVCQVQIHQNKSGVVDSLEGHLGLVSNVAINTRVSSSCGDLLLTSGFDWSLHLYAPKKSQSPLLQWQHYEDYVTDVQWHPEHPAVFATVDASGLCQLWHLNESLEQPSMSTKHAKSAFFCGVWDGKSGQRFAAGNTDGAVKLWQVEKKLTCSASEQQSQVKQLEERISGLEPVSASGGAAGGQGLDYGVRV